MMIEAYFLFTKEKINLSIAQYSYILKLNEVKGLCSTPSVAVQYLLEEYGVKLGKRRSFWPVMSSSETAALKDHSESIKKSKKTIIL